MFIVINGTDNPWLIAFLLGIQLLVPLLQSATNEADESVLVTMLIILVLFVSMASVTKLGNFLRNLYIMRGQFPALSYWEYICEAYRRAIASSAQAAGAATGNTAGATSTGASDSEQYNNMMRTIQKMPTEEFLSPSALATASIHELKDRLRRRDVDYSSCVERNELVELLAKFRGGPSNNDTCCICCEEYQSGDVLRLLRKCKHEFHLECLDRWAFTAVNSQRTPSCPLCNQALD